MMIRRTFEQGDRRRSKEEFKTRPKQGGGDEIIIKKKKKKVWREERSRLKQPKIMREAKRCLQKEREREGEREKRELVATTREWKNALWHKVEFLLGFEFRLQRKKKKKAHTRFFHGWWWMIAVVSWGELPSIVSSDPHPKPPGSIALSSFADATQSLLDD